MRVLARDAGSGKWRLFERPVEVVSVSRHDQVVPALERIESECLHSGRFAAGFIAYEASPAFDRALETQTPDNFPLLQFGLYDQAATCELDGLAADAETAASDIWEPSISEARYREVFEQIQEHIRSGNTYQVNFSYRLRTRLTPDPFALFLQLVGATPPPFAAFVDAGDWVLCSASPELFFHRAGGTVESRPMKGTAARGLWFEQDLENARRLRESKKERAENVMIVDMVRNDLGRIGRPGTVRVVNLLDVERYPTVLQLTSTVATESDASLAEVLSALFPAASVTGTPKARTMEIIAEVECSPRHIYTGTIGFVEPSGRAQFSVAIRTVLVETATGKAEYGVGGGIVSDSTAASEWQETRVKAKVLTTTARSFDLLETLLWKPDGGYVLLGRHLKRLLQSADYFGFQLDLPDVQDALDRFAATLEAAPQRVRLTVSRRGATTLSAAAVDVEAGFPPIVLAAAPVDSGNPFLYHKTTNREVYEQALAGRPGFDDVLLFNELGEVTESTIANVVLSLDGELVTPPLRCGLLPGTLRAHLLDERRIRERAITVQDVHASAARYLVNSVRGFHPVLVLTEP